MRAVRGPPRRGRTAAFLALLTSSVVFGWVAVEAVRLEPIAPTDAAPPPSPPLDPTRDRTTRSLAVALRGVDAAPFHPERRAPLYRFAVEARPDVPIEPVSALRLTGTALLPGRAFVLAALGGDAPQIVRMGESLGRYRLVAVREGEADFEVDGTNVTLSVLDSGS